MPAMFHPKTIALAAAALLTLLIIACGGASEPAPAAPDSNRFGKLCKSR